MQTGETDGKGQKPEGVVPAAPATDQDAQRDDKLRAAVTAWIKQTGIVQRQAARRSGVSESYFSNWLKRDDFPHWKKVQPLVRSWFEHISSGAGGDRDPASATEYIPTAPSEYVRKTIEQIKLTGSVGVIYGPGGVGKTKGLEQALQDDLTSILFRASPYTGCRERWALESAIISALGIRQVEGRKPRLSDAAKVQSEAHRCIIIDDAQYLDRVALETFAFFCRATKSPGVVIGNPELLRRIESLSDQGWSRFGMPHEIRAEYLPRPDAEEMRDGYPPAVIRAFVSQFIDRPTDVLLGHARKIANGRGHIRRLEIALQEVTHASQKGIDPTASLERIAEILGGAA